MIQLSFHPAFDPFHAIFRMLRMRPILEELDSLPNDHVRILDFYLLFPFRIDSIRLTRKHRTYRALASTYQATQPYGNQPEDQNVFYRMEPMQAAALETLAAQRLIDPDSFESGLFCASRTSIPEAISKRINEANESDSELMTFIKVLASEYALSGENGLKHRTGLMEYRYDAV